MFLELNRLMDRDGLNPIHAMTTVATASRHQKQYAFMPILYLLFLFLSFSSLGFF
jgi:hypothetical protein